MPTKRFNTFFKRLVQFRVGAIPRLPSNSIVCLFDTGKSGKYVSTCSAYFARILNHDLNLPESELSLISRNKRDISRIENIEY